MSQTEHDLTHSLLAKITEHIDKGKCASAREEITALLSPHYVKQAEHLPKIIEQAHRLVALYLDAQHENPEGPYDEILSTEGFFEGHPRLAREFYQEAGRRLILQGLSANSHTSAIFYITRAYHLYEQDSTVKTQPFVKQAFVCLYGQAQVLVQSRAFLKSLSLPPAVGTILSPEDIKRSSKLIAKILAIAGQLASVGLTYQLQAFFAEFPIKKWLTFHLAHYSTSPTDEGEQAIHALFAIAEQLQYYEQKEIAQGYYQVLFKQLPPAYSQSTLAEVGNKIVAARAYQHTPTAPKLPPVISSGLNHQKTLKKLCHDLHALSSNNRNSQHLMEAQVSYSQGVMQLVKGMMATLILELGEPPCNFTLLGIGSLGRLELAPYSDLDVALLVAKEEMRASPYFKALITAMQSALYLLGDAWVMSNNEKRSLGLHIDQGDIIELTKAESLLIQRPEQMAEWVINILKETREYNQAGHGKFGFAYALQSPCALYQYKEDAKEDTKDLFETYLSTLYRGYELDKPPEMHPCYRQIAINCLRIHQQEFKLLQNGDKPHLKKHVLEPLTFGYLDRLLYYGLPITQCSLPLMMTRQAPPITLLSHLKAQAYLAHSAIEDITQAWRVLQQLRICQQSKQACSHDEILADETDFCQLHRIQRSIVIPLYYSLPEGDRLQTVPLAFNPMSAALERLISDYRYAAHLKDKIPQQIVMGLVDMLNTQATKPSQYQQQYEILPLILRPLFIEAVEEILEHTPKKQAILNVLYALPNPDGYRPLMKSAQTQWHADLLSLVDNQAAASHPQLTLFSADWSNPQAIEPRAYTLKQTVLNQLFKNEAFLSKPLSQPGRHTVLPIQHEGKLFWAKLLPEQPGVAYMIEQLAWRFSAGGVPSSMLWKVVYP